MRNQERKNIGRKKSKTGNENMKKRKKGEGQTNRQ